MMKKKKQRVIMMVTTTRAKMRKKLQNKKEFLLDGNAPSVTSLAEENVAASPDSDVEPGTSEEETED
eukprot:11078887-Ditylum_brightwellii.AAC.1